MAAYPRQARRRVCAVEMALWDIAGKVYNCPVYQMLGGKWRDTIRIYADTTESKDPKEYGRRAKERKAMGLTWMKMDLGIDMLEGIPNTVMQPSGLSKWELREPASSVYRDRGHRQGHRPALRVCCRGARCDWV